MGENLIPAFLCLKTLTADAGMDGIGSVESGTETESNAGAVAEARSRRGKLYFCNVFTVF